jgi:hypothetical protein
MDAYNRYGMLEPTATFKYHRYDLMCTLERV